MVEPSIQIIKSYFDKDVSFEPDSYATNETKGSKLIERDLWTQHICKVSSILVFIFTLEVTIISVNGSYLK